MNTILSSPPCAGIWRIWSNKPSGCPHKAGMTLCIFLSLLFITLLLPFAHAHAQDITTGLVGHWTLDETSGAAIADSSGNGLHGTWSDGDDNDVTGETGAGQIGTALDFDGSNDYIFISDAPNITFANSDNFTFAAWVKLNSCKANGSKIIEKKSATSDAISLQCYSSDNLATFAARDDNFVYLDNRSTTLINDGIWHHIVGIRNGNTIYTYVDGALETTSGAVNFTGDFLADDIRIGYSYDGGTRQVDGMIDDVRVYNRALSAADIAALYAYTGTTSCSAPSGQTGELIFNNDDNVLQYCNGTSWIAIGPKSALSSGLVGHWKLDETSGSAIADASGNGLNGTWSDGDDNNVTGETGFGVFNNALTFDGTDDYITVPDSASLSFANGDNFTFTAWISTSLCQANGSKIIEKKFGAADTIQLECDAGTGIPMMGVRDDNGISAEAQGTTDLQDSAWHHLAGVKKGNNVYIYVDGTLEGSDSAAFTGDILNGNILIGSSIDGGARRVNGMIDDVRIYNRALSKNEIQSLYDMSPSCMEPPVSPPVAHWTMDETSGNVIADSSANAIHGTWIDGDDNDVSGETEPGIFGNALRFDGTDDYINIPHNVLLELPDSSGTVMGWIKLDSNDIGQNRIWPVFRKLERGNQFDDGSYQLEMYQYSAVVTPRVAGKFDVQPLVETTSSIQPNQWYHIAMSWDADNAYVYLDGTIKQSGAKPGTIVYDENASAQIGQGKGHGGAIEQADGLIDEVRIYNETLTPTEISAIYGATGGECTVALCSNPWGEKGEIIYNSDFNVMQYCNGGRWIAMGRPGNGGVNCSSPYGLAGTLRYDLDGNVLMYCEGDEWMAVSGYAANPLPPPPPPPTDPCDPANSPTAGTVCTDGTVYAGDTPDGNVPMFVPPTDQASGFATHWGTAGFATGSTSTTDGDGNSADVYAHVMADDGFANPPSHTPNVFVVCHDLNFGGHTDWYVPARDELSVIYSNAAAIGGFNTSGPYYWSSTEASSTNAWRRRFSFNYEENYTKELTANLVRCARHD